ncbi:hypothetical protein F511_35098 [Dorcoceras hygrometricum]|uniref:Uncharacterized protein n=1 Tax=Dorcoceras hygrometricum TaxID=472368 RepID=A0A2Z7DJE2_9LAMI|nr:hypothetical protein F511_35098 [Dorcoceras hygrometricum]
MRSVVASHGPGSNPRGNATCNAILLQCIRFYRSSVFNILDRHCPPSSDVLPLNLGVLLITLLATRAWLRPVSRGNRHFTVGGGRLRQSGPRPEGRLLRQPALEGLTRSARTDSPRQVDRNKFRQSEAAAAAQGGG